MRQDMEALLYSYSVDLVLSGHVHAYERVRPVYDGCLTRAGRCTSTSATAATARARTCPGWNTAAVVRLHESSFGAGLLRLENATHAKYVAAPRAKAQEPEHLDDADDCATVTWGK